MALARELQAFETRIGHRFATPDLLIRAMTHSSLGSPSRPDNQRLEFLGDRVLGLVIAEALMGEDETAREGKLAPRFNALVRKETCAEVAREIDLGEVLKLGKSEMVTGGRRKDALLGDAMEALIAAVYRDAGFDAARGFVLRLWGKRIEAVDEDARDPKTALQEWAQSRKMPPPSYELVRRAGPDHAPEFTIAVTLKNGEAAQAVAGNKRSAEQAAAKELLERMETSDG